MSNGLHCLLLIRESENGRFISQLEIGYWLDIASGLINAYSKSFGAMGFCTIGGYTYNPYAYLLTSNGFGEKSRLIYRQFKNLHKLFRITREHNTKLFVSLSDHGGQWAAFYGLDDLTESPISCCLRPDWSYSR